MLALYRSGRQAEALEVYRNARRVLVEQVGVEPGPELQRLHQAVLNHDASLELPTRRRGARATERRRGSPSAGRVPTGSPAQRGAAASEPDDRSRARGQRGRGAAAGRARAAAHAHRAGRRRQDTARARSRARGRGRLRRRRVLRVARRRSSGRRMSPGRSSARWRSSPLAGESPERTRSSASWPPSICCWSSTTASTCRPPRRSSEAAGRPCPGHHGAGHEPRAAGRAGRADAIRCRRWRCPARRDGSGAIWPVSTPSRCSASARGRMTRSFELGARQRRLRSRRSAGGVDGLPLAIELAAARCGLLSPGRDRRSPGRRTARARAAGPRDAPARQQTLRATIDWSHDLLDARREGDCFARFAVFAGGATVEAAEAITGAGIDTLDRLVAKSLLVRRHADGRTRLGMLETIRAYAAERFAAIPDCDAVRERHFHYFLSLAAAPRARFGARRPEPCASISRLWTARSRTSAPRSSGRSSKTPWVQVLDMSAALIDYWMRRDRFAEARPIGSSRRCRSQTPRREPGGARSRTVQGVLAPLGTRATRRAPCAPDRRPRQSPGRCRIR